jgi:endo-1,4-beta-xylanase
VSLKLLDSKGESLPSGMEVRVELINHAFLFGCNVFNLFGFEGDTTQQKLYADRLEQLFNFATVPFYWQWYEWTEGEEDVLPRTEDMAAWCRENNITPKGHPLIWHESVPEWAMSISDDEIEDRLKKRVQDIVQDFDGSVDHFDVINESVVSHTFDNPVGRWVESVGAVEAAARAFSWVEAVNDDAFLLINDYNVSGEGGDLYSAQIAGLIEKNIVPDAVGLQSHMHKGVWDDQTLRSVCNNFAQLDLPIHFTELTILSGSLMHQKSMN